MVKIEKNQVYSTDGKFIRRHGSETYFKRSMALPTDREADFEEVDEVPTFTKAEYDAKVSELVRERYSDNEEFAIQRKYLNTINGNPDAEAVEEYNAYNAYVEDCKVRAKDPELYKLEEPDD